MISSCHTSAQDILCLLSSFSIKSKSLAWLIRLYSIWFLAAFLISCLASLPHDCTSGTWIFLFLQISNPVGPQNLAFLFPLPGMLFPRSFTHPTCHSNLNSNASNLNNEEKMSTDADKGTNLSGMDNLLLSIVWRILAVH